MIIMIFGYVFHTAIGSLVNHMGGPAAPKALVYGIAVIPVGLLIGTIGFIAAFANEKRVIREIGV
jgi:hypothetical protein